MDILSNWLPTTSKKEEETPQPTGGLVKSLVAGRTIAAASVQPGDSCEFGSLTYFGLCGMAGEVRYNFYM